MLERVWRKGNLLKLLVGMQTSTATMENSGDSLKAIALLGIHTKETRIERDTCTPKFTAALFLIGKDVEVTWISISRRMDKEAVVHIHNGILLSH